MYSLVIGGAGFVGSNLCKALLQAGHDVYILDNYSTGTKNNYVNGAHYKKGNAQSINEYSMPDKVDYVFHLGEYSRVEQSVTEPFEAIENICTTIIPVIKYCHKTGAKLIYSGSSTKFGDSLSPYSIAKESNTWMVKNLCEYFKIRYCITYFYNVYGKNEIKNGKYATVVAKFIEQKKLNNEVCVNYPGTQKRNFTHVSDIVDGIIKVAYDGDGDLYGIGSEESFSIIELAKMIGVRFYIGPAKLGNRTESKLITDNTKKLGWYAKTSLVDYIENLKNDRQN
jgi:UDP-glucose 4-epimerase